VTLSGFLIVDKPRGMTSHDVVNAVKRAARAVSGVKIKVGHAGTLDPMATGVLVVCVGDATRLSEYVMASDKTYEARVKLGEATDTYDADGEITARYDAAHITRGTVELALEAFRGDIQQIPPMYSAIKQGGKKLYDLARAGVTVDRAPRAVTISRLTITDWHPPELSLEVVCSAGTYIRSLAHDLGESLCVGAHLTGLRRTRSGAFSHAQALPLNQLTANAAHAFTHMITSADGLRDWYTVTLDDDALTHLRHGRAFARGEADRAVRADTLARGLDDAGGLVAVLRAGPDGQWHPHKVLGDTTHSQRNEA
jgi:tRNA pseudouridine55 synthase